VDSPVAASVDLQRLQAGNTVERNVAELVTSVSDLRMDLHAIRGEIRSLRRQPEMVRQMIFGLDHLIQEAREQKKPGAERRLRGLRASLAADPSLAVMPREAETDSALAPTPSERIMLVEWLATTRREVGLRSPEGDDQG
jgi:hypothetical protein